MYKQYKYKFVFHRPQSVEWYYPYVGQIFF